MRLPLHILGLSLLLPVFAGCVPVPAETQEETPTATGSQAEVVEEEFVETEAPMPTPLETLEERQLPAGLLEIGAADARVTLLMFTEHHCGYCKEFQEEQMTLLLEEFVRPGRLKIQIGVLPLKKYLDSDLGATGMMCATQQGKGLAMHETLFRQTTDADVLTKTAEALALDVKTFTACLKSEETATMLKAMQSLAATLDVTLVPTFFINGEKSVGLPYYADLRGAIEAKM